MGIMSSTLSGIRNVTEVVTHRNTARQRKAAIYAEWEQWEKEATPGEKRDMAVIRMKHCYKRECHSLVLSYLTLKDLPKTLPASVQTLDISSNQLTQLPTLPASLQKLDVSNNQLTQLPTLPASMLELNARDNQLTQLPMLPAFLRELNVNDNRLTEPPILPTLLQRFDISSNQLTQLPQIPTYLRELIASYNLLTHLPQPLPHSLLLLNISGNHFTQVPETIMTLTPHCHVTLESNPLSVAAYQYLNRVMLDSNYQGPRITYSIPTPLPRTSVQSLKETVASWYPSEHHDAIYLTWGELEREENAMAFANFLYQLAKTVNVKAKQEKSPPVFTQHVCNWLSELSEHPDLRQQTFIIAQGATENCEDRVSLTFNEMQKARVVHSVAKGDYDKQLPKLITLAREMFRQECLETIARNKVKVLQSSGKHIDEIEVYLAYQVKLRASLQLTSGVKDMRFFDVSDVTQNDLQEATREVQYKENAVFRTWLANWSPWESVLQRLTGSAYTLVLDNLADYPMSAKFNEAVDLALQALNLVGDQDVQVDAKRSIEKDIMAKENNKRKISFTKDFLERHQLSVLLVPHWKTLVIPM